MRLRALSAVLPLCFLAGLLSCDESAPRRDCFARVWIPASNAEPFVRGSWDDFAEPGQVALPYDDAFRLLRLKLPPGEHQYQVRRAGQWVSDPANPLAGFRESDAAEVSLLFVPDCDRGTLAIWETEHLGSEVRVRGQYLAADSAAAAAPETLQISGDGRELLRVKRFDAATGEFELSAKSDTPTRLALTISVADTAGQRSDETGLSVFPGALAPDPADGLLYQIMIDRFRTDDGSPPPTPTSPGARAGGTLRGITSAIGDGTFAALGITGLWLSPVYENPVEARLGVDGREYEGYHGYWPKESRKVDPRIGGEEALDELVETAHAAGLTVLLDLVPNHVYETNERYQARESDASFYPAGCVCGTPACPWAENIQTCWFTDYLPDVRWEYPGAMRQAADEALFWRDRFGLDGFRVDAVPMMPRATSRYLARELRTRTRPREATFLLGEVFTGPGIGALGQLGYFLGPDTLDSVFDFPLMWASRAAIADGSAGFDELEATLVAGEAQFAGSGATMAHMLGNHDVTRFISVAHGDASGDPWLAPANQPTTAEPYRRAALGHALVLTLPGLPVIYYGDEVGLAGAADPDSRRVQPSEASLSLEQADLLELTRKLGKLRRCSAHLRRGTRTPLWVSPRVYAYERRAEGSFGRAVVLLHAGTGPAEAELDGALFPPGSYVDVLTGESLELGPGQTVMIPPLSARVLLSAGDPCADG